MDPNKKALKNLTPAPTEPQVAVMDDGEPPPPVLLLQGLGPVAPRHMTICSVHFRPMTNQFMHSGRKQFVLKAASRGSYTTLRIYDSQQGVPNWPDFNQPPEILPMPVPVETIMADLESNWGYMRTSRKGVFKLGIGRLEGDTPTDEELKRFRGDEERMCVAVVNEADGLFAASKGAEITEFHRECLTWLGSEQRPWFSEITAVVSKVGPLTGNRIPMTALADGPHDLLEWYAKTGLDPLNFGDTHIAAFFKTNPHLLKRPQTGAGG